MSRFTAVRIITLLAVVAIVAPLHGIFVLPELENVPVDRLVRNLEEQLRANPNDIQTRLNLSRLHAMAYASKSSSARVDSGKYGGRAGEPWFGNEPGSFREVVVTPASDPATRAEATAHLQAAVAGYDEVLRRQPDHLVARLGRAWCIDQTGDRAAAIAAYRAAFELAWKKESDGDLPGLQNLMPATVEIAGYLTRLLDPRNDAAEIADVQTKRARIQEAMRTRPITPIVIPLQRDAALGDLIDSSASVAFDADGSGLRRRWTWITPRGGWLVFDRTHRRQVTSALQWFGGVTFWLFWDTGYAPLRALDDNRSGALTGAELDGLAIWCDGNRNGVSERSEVKPVADWNIVQLSWEFDWLDRPDALAVAPAGVTFRDGSTRPTYDVLLRRR